MVLTHKQDFLNGKDGRTEGEIALPPHTQSSYLLFPQANETIMRKFCKT